MAAYKKESETRTVESSLAHVSCFNFKPTESIVLPVIAAIGAISTIDKIGTSAINAFKHLTSNGQSSGTSDPKSDAGSFAAVLASLGVGK
jgi:hypothetical protein